MRPAVPWTRLDHIREPTASLDGWRAKAHRLGEKRPQMIAGALARSVRFEFCPEFCRRHKPYVRRAPGRMGSIPADLSKILARMYKAVRRRRTPRGRKIICGLAKECRGAKWRSTRLHQTGRLPRIVEALAITLVGSVD